MCLCDINYYIHSILCLIYCTGHVSRTYRYQDKDVFFKSVEKTPDQIVSLSDFKEKTTRINTLSSEIKQATLLAH